MDFTGPPIFHDFLISRVSMSNKDKIPFPFPVMTELVCLAKFEGMTFAVTLRFFPFKDSLISGTIGKGLVSPLFKSRMQAG